jgi:hypothetical protein
MLIKIINVSTETVPGKGKGRPYEQAEVVYKNERGEAKTWKLVSFSNPQVFETLKNSKSGEQYEITITKDGEYSKWSSATLSDGTAPAAVGTPANPAPAKTAGSTYETKEERALKQRLIVRQSSLAQAVALLPDSDVISILEVADRFAAWVYKEPDLFTEVEEDIPY